MPRIFKKRKLSASRSLEVAEPSQKRTLIVRLPLPRTLQQHALANNLRRQVTDLEKEKQILSTTVAQLEERHRTGTTTLQKEIADLREENKRLNQKIKPIEEEKKNMVRREADYEAIIAHLKSELRSERARSEMSEEALRRSRKQAANMSQLQSNVEPQRNKNEKDGETRKREMLEKFREFLDAQT